MNSNQVIYYSLPITETSNQEDSIIGRSGKLSKKNETDVLAQRGKIRAELETLEDHPWAGF